MLNQTTTPSQRTELSFARLIMLGIAAKFVIDTGFQIFNPYMTIFAAGLGVDVITMDRLVSLISAMGLLAPILGSLADRLGYRLIMRFGLLSAALGAFLFGNSTNLWLAVISLILMGIGLSVFVPMLHAYLSAKIPYSRRARGIGMVEYSWALAGIVGLSLMGQLIAVSNWRMPFFVLAIGLLIAWLAFGTLPPVPLPERSLDSNGSKDGNVFRNWRHWPQLLRAYFDLGATARSAWATILAGTLNFFAGLHIVIVHGVWLTQEYGLGPAQLGLVALVLGIADLGGSVLVSLAGDQIGKRRSLFFGTFGSLMVYILLPFLNIGLVSAVISLVMLRFCLEFIVISNIPLLSEQVPEQRGKVLSLSAAFYLTSGTLVGFTGPWAYTAYGVWGLGPVSAVMAGLSLLIIWAWVKEVI